MSAPSDKPTKGFFRRFRDLIDELGQCEELELKGAVRIGARKVRFPGGVAPIQIQLGGEKGKRLDLHPELVLRADGETQEDGKLPGVADLGAADHEQQRHEDQDAGVPA